MHERFGMLNRESTDLSDMVGKPYRELVVFCSSSRCANKSGLRHGAFIDAGSHVRAFKNCPVCGSTSLKFERMSEHWIEDKILARERKAKRSA